MAISKISQDLVADVYEALKAENINPSLDRIRERLGTGSKGTIQAHLKAYLQSSSEKETLANVALPEAVVSVLQKAFNETSDQAKSAQTEQNNNLSMLLDESDALRQDSEDRIKEFETSLNEKSELLSKMQETNVKDTAAFEQKIMDLESRLKITDEKLDNSIRAQEISRTESAKAQLQGERADKAAEISQKKADNLEQELAQLKTNLSEADKNASTFKAVSEEQKKAILSMEKQLAKSETTMEKQLAKSDKNINELADKRDALQSKLDVATTEKADISANSAADKATIAELKNQIKTLSGNKKD